MTNLNLNCWKFKISTLKYHSGLDPKSEFVLENKNEGAKNCLNQMLKDINFGGQGNNEIPVFIFTKNA